MAKIPTYTPTDHKPEAPREPLPAKWYAMVITESEVVHTKDGQGQYLKLTHQIIEEWHPEFKGRKVFNNLNLWNKNEETVRIANGDLSQLCQKGLGITAAFEDTTILHNKPIAVKLKVRAAKGEFSAQNEVAGYDSYESRFKKGGTPTPVKTEAPAAPSGDAPAPTTGGEEATVPQAGGKMPWET